MGISTSSRVIILNIRSSVVLTVHIKSFPPFLDRVIVLVNFKEVYIRTGNFIIGRLSKVRFNLEIRVSL